MRTSAYRVHGMMQSYFTRKLTGYFDYKGIPWLFRRFPGASPEATAAGFPGGVPLVETPDGEFMWDSTAMIHHLELRFPEPAVLPADPVQRFLCYVIEDVADEWLYRPAVGTRWHFEANAAVGGFELARDIAVQAPLACDQAHAAVRAHVRSSCPPLGVTEGNIEHWVSDVLRPWMRRLDAHIAQRPYLFGARPSLADFALFGGNAAHFINDPLCRRWISAATALTLSPFTSVMTAVPPRCAKPIAVARPIPEPAPVIRPILPSKRIAIPPFQCLPGSIVWTTSQPSNSGCPR